MGIKSLQEARKLPEKSMFRYKERSLPDGIKQVVPYFRELVAVELDDDDILVFEDADGTPMHIGYDSEGAYKTPM